jgi:hypothetical protein
MSLFELFIKGVVFFGFGNGNVEMKPGGIFEGVERQMP